jgi:chaperonin cofactor prefoldin
VKEWPMEVINPQLKELERKHEELKSTVDYMRGEFEELRRTARDTTRQTIWQFIIFTITMASVMLAGLKYQADVLRKEMDIRFEAMERRIEQSEKSITARFEDLKKDLTSRFDDLRQEVRDSRK